MLDDKYMPEELKENIDDIHSRMLQEVPSNINPVQGDVFWDTTRPSAIEISKLKNETLASVISSFFTQLSNGRFLELRAEEEWLERRGATKALGEVTFRGDSEIIIPAGTIVMTPSSESSNSLEFVTLSECIIGEEGSATVEIESLEPGSLGNVRAGEIKIIERQINGLTSLTNVKRLSGGADIEDDDTLRQRILDVKRKRPLSGNVSDYISWTKKVDGVGAVHVKPLWNGAGTVKILILGLDGNPANQDLISIVQERLDPISGTGNGDAPIGARVTVCAPTMKPITIKAKFDLSRDFEIVSNAVKAEVDKYLKGLNIDGVIVYKAIEAVIGQLILDGTITDYSNLEVNGVSENIELVEQVAYVKEVVNDVK